MGWFAIAVLLAVFAALALTRIDPAAILLSGLVVLVVAGAVKPAQALSGFGNTGLVTVAFLFVVAAALRETGASSLLVQRMLGANRSVRSAQARIIFPVTATSAFLNNTPVVAVLMPVVHDWARRHRVAVSKLLIPLSYASILGGMCTLIGTSTNLIVNGLYLEAGYEGIGIFEIGRVGLPAAAAGIAFLLLFGRILLPDRQPAAETLADPRQYTVEMKVSSNGPLVGKTIEAAGLRNLPGSYLMEIQRGDRVIAAVGPRERLQAEDRLVFVGIVESMVDLQKLPGLEPAADQVFKLDAPRGERVLVEAVVSNSFPLLGRTIREGRFRSRYNAVVIAVSRNGERIRSKIGDIVLRPGDTLLLEGLPNFVTQQRNSKDFYLVSQLEDSTPPRRERLPMALGILVAMVVAVAAGWLSMLQGAMVAAGIMVFAGACSEETAWRSVDWRVLIAIGSAIGIGRTLESTGAAAVLGERIVALGASEPWLALTAVYIATNLTSELITNNAAAVLMFPIAKAVAATVGMGLMPFVIVLMIASSASFSTPIGYQTNLMIYGPGGYRFSDFLRIGLPLNLLVAVVALVVTLYTWGI